jgi:hypothetical protein
MALPFSLLAVASAATPDAGMPPEARRLLLERRDVLKQLSELQLKSYQQGEASFAAALLAYRELLDADLELADQRFERIEIYKRLLKSMQDLEATTKELFKAQEASITDVLSSAAARLKVQADLINEQAKSVN